MLGLSCRLRALGLREAWVPPTVKELLRSSGSVVKNLPANAKDRGDLGLIPGLGRSPEEGNGYPLQYSGLENFLDCIVCGVTKSRTQLNDFHFPLYLHLVIMCIYLK